MLDVQMINRFFKIFDVINFRFCFIAQNIALFVWTS